MASVSKKFFIANKTILYYYPLRKRNTHILDNPFGCDILLGMKHTIRPIKWLFAPPEREFPAEPLVIELLLIFAVMSTFFLEPSREQFTIYTIIFLFYSFIRFVGYHHHLKYVLYVASAFLLIYFN